MNDRTYLGLVRRLENEASLSARPFQLKVVAIAGAAYLTLFLALIVIAAFVLFALDVAGSRRNPVAFVQVAAFGLFMLPVLYTALRALLMRLPPPTGVALTATDAPLLFAFLRKMQQALGGPSIREVLIDGDFNASITQVPRWGLFGPHDTYLVLGLPYMMAMTPAEMLATVAHEYGHIAGQHGKVHAWIYRQRITFSAVYQKVAQAGEDDWINGSLARALAWFAPYFNAYTFVLSRQQEYEADRAASQLVGPGPNAAGLIRGALIGRWLQDEFWRRFFLQAESVQEPDPKPYAALRKLLIAGHGRWTRQEWLNELMADKSDYLDTHPCLRDRLDAIGAEATLPSQVTTTAAEHLLGGALDRFIGSLDGGWWQRERRDWQARHRRVTNGRIRMRTLSQGAIAGLSVQEIHELALLQAEFATAPEAKATLEHLLRHEHGPFPRAELAYGRILLHEGDRRGLQSLEAAARCEQSVLDECLDLGYRFLCTHDGPAEAQKWVDELVEAC